MSENKQAAAVSLDSKLFHILQYINRCITASSSALVYLTWLMNGNAVLYF